MKAPVLTTVGELITILFDETEYLDAMNARERRLLVAYLLDDLLRRSSLTGARRRALRWSLSQAVSSRPRRWA